MCGCCVCVIEKVCTCEPVGCGGICGNKLEGLMPLTGPERGKIPFRKL